MITKLAIDDVFYTYSFDCLFSTCIYLSLSAFLHRYEIMCQSWMHSPDDRPSFTDVAARLDKLLDDKTTEVLSTQTPSSVLKMLSFYMPLEQFSGMISSLFHAIQKCFNCFKTPTS